jgi:purine-cytosine permease-like protein
MAKSKHRTITRRLTDSDIKEIKLAKRPSIVIAILFSFILSFIVIMAIDDYYQHNTLSILGLLIGMQIPFYFIGYLMRRKYIKDLQSGEKIGHVYPVQMEQEFTDYEAGSGTLFIGQRMKGFQRHNVIANNTIYRVRPELAEAIQKGDHIIVYFARHSNFRLSIEKYSDYSSYSRKDEKSYI